MKERENVQAQSQLRQNPIRNLRGSVWCLACMMICKYYGRFQAWKLKLVGVHYILMADWPLFVGVYLFIYSFIYLLQYEKAQKCSKKKTEKSD